MQYFRKSTSYDPQTNGTTISFITITQKQAEKEQQAFKEAEIAERDPEKEKLEQTKKQENGGIAEKEKER